jgi:GT2 family glycosyltransferase
MAQQHLRIAVVICTLGRPSVLHDTVLSLTEQTIPPEEILIGTPSEESVQSETLKLPKTRLIKTNLGLTRQRNACLDEVASGMDLIAFVDDDMEFCRDYFEQMIRLFSENPDVVAASGSLLHDGGINSPIDRQKAAIMCRTTELQLATDPRTFESRAYAYGCNMVFRAEEIKDIRFDEELPLYAWLEDSDFSHRAVSGRSRGPVTCLRAKAVHLGWQGGRVAGIRLGFSQIINPLYLWRKSRPFSLMHFVVHYWLRCLVGNLLGTIHGPEIEDRPGRLQGNIRGFLHVLQGRCDPKLASQLGTGADSRSS